MCSAGSRVLPTWRGRDRVDAAFTLALATYNLIRPPKLLAVPIPYVSEPMATGSRASFEAYRIVFAPALRVEPRRDISGCKYAETSRPALLLVAENAVRYL